MRTIEQAKEDRWRLSDNAELRAHCKELGIPYGPNSKEATMRNALLSNFGMVDEAIPTQLATRRVRNRVLPEIGLHLGRGKWEGRCHLVILHRRPGEGQESGGIYPTVNGYGFPIKYEETVALPEPHYLALKNAMLPKGRMVKEADSDGNVMTRTVINHERAYNMDYIGVDPNTKDRPGSLIEYYNAKGEQWFHELTDKEVREIYAYIGDLPMYERMQDGKMVPFSPEVLKEKLINLFFPEVFGGQENAA